MSGEPNDFNRANSYSLKAEGNRSDDAEKLKRLCAEKELQARLPVASPSEELDAALPSEERVKMLEGFRQVGQTDATN